MTKETRAARTGGDCPELDVGIRPDIVSPLNTFAVLKNGTAVFVAPRAVPRPSWRNTPAQMARAQRMVDAPDIVERDSREQQLTIDIERALDTGKPIDGFLRMERTLSGAVRVLPYRGKPMTYRDVRTLARTLDREQGNMDILRTLGLAEALAPTRSLARAAPTPKKPKQWVTLSGGFDALRR